MGRVSAGSGLFSGIDTASLIDSLINAESGPKRLAQRRIIQLQSLQAAYLDINSRLGAMRTAAQNLRTGNVFQSNRATSSKDDVLTATASTNATPGTYSFIVDRLVSSQQYLSRGFASATSGGLGAGTFTFESARARLDRDTNLADLNGGSGVSRGKIIVSDAAGHSATVDLSRAATVNDVLDALNGAGGGLNLSARVEGGRFVISSGVNSNLTIASAFGYSTAESLGIAASGASPTVTGQTVYRMTEGTALRALNDGNGVFLNSQSGQARYDFTITVGGTAVNINIGDIYNAEGGITESAPTTIEGVLNRINSQLETALGDPDVRASIASDGASLQIVDTQSRTLEVTENPTAGANTARDLGIRTSGPVTGTLSGRRILASLNSVLASSLNGGAGISGDGQLTITTRDGAVHNFSVSTTSSVTDIIQAINTAGGSSFRASLNSRGTGITISDTTNGSQNLIIAGDTASSLGIATDPSGVATSRVVGANLQHQYITQGTLLNSLRGGQGIGQGEFRITDSTGAVANVTINDNQSTIDDVIRLINSRGIRVKARINTNGDGIELYEDAGGGTIKIKVEEISGTVATNLNLKGEAAGTGTENVINGTFERSVTFLATDTLQQMASKINSAGVGIQATVITDGSGSTPFRLSLASRTTGSAGRFIVDTGDFDLGESILDNGNDARVIYGSSDPARGVLLTSTRNTLDSVIQGVTIDLKSISSDPVTLSVTRDTSAIETGIDTFIKTFNELTSRIKSQTSYNQETNTRGTLLGDSTTELLRQGLFRTIQGRAQGVSGSFQSLLDVGFKVGQGGELTLDKDRLRAALEQDPEAVARLFTSRELQPSTPTSVNGEPGITTTDPNAGQQFSSLGVFAQMEELANSYLNTVDGRLTKRSQTIRDQISFQTRRVSDFDAKLEDKRKILQQQFLAMEQAIGRLQSQSSALSGISSLSG
ncbi:MAG: flagellar filament capping protein FliD [Phycisphaeraceae bacterium]|nr:flagellar filament capping protein FliD [Phycisphaeraceae bacterium]